MELVRSQGNREQRAPLTQRSHHPRWCWSGSTVQYLVHVLEVDQCLVWASLGVRLPVWVRFVVTAMSSVFFFFGEREREKEIRCDFGLFVNGYGFKFLIICCDFGFFLFLGMGNYHQLIVWNWLDQLGDRIFYVNLLWFFFRKF